MQKWKMNWCKQGGEESMLWSLCGSQIMLCFCQILTGNWFKSYFLLGLLPPLLQMFPLKDGEQGGVLAAVPLIRTSLHCQGLWGDCGGNNEHGKSSPLQREAFKSQITTLGVSIYFFCFCITLGGNSSTNSTWRHEKCWGCSKFSCCWFLVPSGSDFQNQCT